MKRSRDKALLRRIISSLAAAVAFFCTTGCSVFGIRTVEHATYEVMEKQGPFEIRKYPRLLLVETSVQPQGGSENSAFFELFDYIRGENESRTKIEMTAPVLIESPDSVAPEGESIAMTAPVLRQETEEGMKMSFVLPAEFDVDSVPQPRSPKVAVRVLESARVATLRYSGSRSDKNFDRHAEELRLWMEEQGFTSSSDAMYAGYDPPFTLPFLKRHEVWITLP